MTDISPFSFITTPNDEPFPSTIAFSSVPHVDPMNNSTAMAPPPTFAEAQRRLAARRRARTAEAAQTAAAAAAATRQSSAALRARLDGVAGPLQRVGASALSAWDAVARRFAGDRHLSAPAFRVTQVDAALLDEELLGMLGGQVDEALRYVGGGGLRDDWGAEMLLVLRAALFKLTVWDRDATYGAALQNLRYADARHEGAVPAAPSRWQKAAYGLVTVGGRYAWTKWAAWLRDHDEDEDENDGGRVRRLARLTGLASDAHAGEALVSFLVFLRHGRYRTLLDRVLRMRLVPPTSQVSHEVSFEYLNRQLVWHAFTEFLLFVLPLVGLHRWRRWLARTWRRTKTAVVRAVGGSTPEESVPTGELAFLPERTCAICYQDQNAATSEADLMAAAAASSGVVGSAETDVTNAYEAVPCGCLYCYVCVATRIEREEGDGWPCLRCGAVVTACRPWSGDVLEPGGLPLTTSAATTPSGSPSHPHKTVGFADDVNYDEETTEDVDSDEHVISSSDTDSYARGSNAGVRLEA